MTIDINELRRLAQAASHPATRGRWMRLFGERTVYDRMEDGCRGIPVVSTPVSPPHPFEAACLDFIAAANPAAVSELLNRLEEAENAWKISDKTVYDLTEKVIPNIQEKLEAAEKERDFAKEEAERLLALAHDQNNDLIRLREEGRTLRAKIEQMEKQEPVAHVWRCDNGHVHGSCDSELLMGQQLYTLPGAQGE